MIAIYLIGFYGGKILDGLYGLVTLFFSFEWYNTIKSIIIWCKSIYVKRMITSGVCILFLVVILSLFYLFCNKYGLE
jgi:hypothetical protein